MKDAIRYRGLAEQARIAAWGTSTRETAEAMLQMAADYERKAEELEKRSGLALQTAA